MSAGVDVRSEMIDELRDVLLKIPEAVTQMFLERLAGARQIFTYGVGREGLVLRSFCMRLYHLGLDAHVVGDMTTPHLERGDLLVTSSGPGFFSTVSALMNVAHGSGATVLILTANADAELPRRASDVVVIPGQTMGAGAGERPSIQPMGSLYEQAMWLYLDYVVLRLAHRLGRAFGEMSQRHTNLE